VAIVKPFRVRAVLAALRLDSIRGATVREVMGFGRQKDRLHHYRGSEYSGSFLPKVEIALFVEEPDLEPTLRTLVSQARTGRMGDGKILVLPCEPQFMVW
jgi:nitrogen regulatory protein PII